LELDGVGGGVGLEGCDREVMKVIAISGKGGTGKTTLAVMVIRWLHANRSKSILAVDADPAANLNEMLGVTAKETVGAIREEMRSQAGALPGGMSKQRFLEYKIQTCLVETPDFDLITMGRPEGPGCYCYANNLLRDIMDTVGKNYAYVVIDNEAGMEHLSRRTTRDVDHLLIVANPTVLAVRTAGKINRLAGELAVAFGERHLIVNRVGGPLPGPVARAVTEQDLKQLCLIPEDDGLLSLDRAGKPLWPVVPETEAYRSLDEGLSRLIERRRGQ
jgi:CO dehydrogenase maturation factor